MQPEHEILRLLLAYQDVWYSHFPPLSRRAEWHIVHHLCMRGRNGSSVGELYGLVKQIFLLDDATVKERLLALGQLGFCELDPGGPIHARTVVTPTHGLLTKFDSHLLAFAPALSITARVLGIVMPAPPSGDLLPQHRTLLLQPLDIYAEEWGPALDRVFEHRRLSPQRRMDAKRHLMSPSHWNLLHRAARYDYEAEDTGAAKTGILADRLAAQLLQLTGQTLQTTRDHMTYLLESGLLQRMKGKALHVSLSHEAMTQLHLALGRTARRLPAGLQVLTDGRAPVPAGHAASSIDEPEDRTVTIPLNWPGRAAPQPRRFLEIIDATGGSRRVPLRPPLTIGRLAPSDIVLNSGDISRIHCRIDEDGAYLAVTDLHSTNGTFVNGRKIAGATVLKTGDRLEVGSYVLAYQEENGLAGTDRDEATQRGRVEPLAARRQNAARSIR
jgi:hypothetical protein